MKIGVLIATLEKIRESHGEIDVQLQNDPDEKMDGIVNYPDFFIVEEGYDEGFVVNLRPWPY